MRKTLIPVVMTMLLGTGAAALPLLPAARADERPAGAAWYARPSHIEGRIAFLKAELHITDAQTAQWNAVADALRDGDKTMRDAWAQLRPSGDAKPSALDRLAGMQKIAEIRADTLSKLLAAVKPLYETMSDDQKKAADELLAGRFGRMHHRPI